ncbi:MAG: alpha/beta hydrolase [Anaerolineae bacterium]
MEPSLSLILHRRYVKLHRNFTVTTEDGVAIRGVHLGERGDVLLVYCHGLFDNKNFWRVPRFVESLAEDFDAIAFDFRGHGESEGRCTFGREEIRDLKAVLDYAREQRYHTIVAIGASMGGAIVLRTFGHCGGLDGIVTIGAFADANHLRRLPTRLTLPLIFETEAGHALARWARGTRLGDLRAMEQPLDLADRVHIPLLVIHGEWDPLIEPAQATQLIDRAPEPKQVVIIPHGGHVASNLNDETCRLIVGWVRREVLSGGVSQT